MSSQVDPGVGDQEDHGRREREREAAHQGTAREMEDDGRDTAVEEGRHRGVAAREAVRLFRDEGRPEGGTGPVIRDLENRLEQPSAQDDAREEDRAHAVAAVEKKSDDDERGRKQEGVSPEDGDRARGAVVRLSMELLDRRRHRLVERGRAVEVEDMVGETGEEDREDTAGEEAGCQVEADGAFARESGAQEGAPPRGARRVGDRDGRHFQRIAPSNRQR